MREERVGRWVKSRLVGACASRRWNGTRTGERYERRVDTVAVRAEVVWERVVAA